MKTIVAMDTSQYALVALDKALDLVGRFGGELFVLSVVPDIGVVDEMSNRLVDKLVAESEAVVKAAKGKAEGAGVVVKGRVEQGTSPADAIIGYASEIGADLIVVGHRGTTNLERFLVGSVAQRLVLHAPCSVMVVK